MCLHGRLDGCSGEAFVNRRAVVKSLLCRNVWNGARFCFYMSPEQSDLTFVSDNRIIIYNNMKKRAFSSLLFC